MMEPVSVIIFLSGSQTGEINLTGERRYTTINPGRLLFCLLQEEPFGRIIMAVHGERGELWIKSKTLTATKLAAGSYCTYSN